jgi:hypothetical protein
VARWPTRRRVSRTTFPEGGSSASWWTHFLSSFTRRKRATCEPDRGFKNSDSHSISRSNASSVCRCLAGRSYAPSAALAADISTCDRTGKSSHHGQPRCGMNEGQSWGMVSGRGLRMHNPRHYPGGGEVYLPIDGPGPVNRQRRYWWGSSVRPAVLSCRAAGSWGLRFPAARWRLKARAPSSRCDSGHKLALLNLRTPYARPRQCPWTKTGSHAHAGSASMLRHRSV